MSLIQEALERAGRLPDYKSEILTTPPAAVVAPKIKKFRGLPKLAMSTKALRNSLLVLLALFSTAGLLHLTVSLPKAFPKKTIPKAVWGGSLSLVSSDSIQKPEFKLTGITYSRSNEPLALINNQVVGVGERLKEDAVVKEIQNRNVTLEFRGSTITLSL